MIHFKYVGIKDMHNIYYLGLSGERSLPFGLLVVISHFVFCFLFVCCCFFFWGGGWIWVLIASVPDLCIFFDFNK